MLARSRKKSGKFTLDHNLEKDWIRAFVFEKQTKFLDGNLEKQKQVRNKTLLKEV